MSPNPCAVSSKRDTSGIRCTGYLMPTSLLPFSSSARTARMLRSDLESEPSCRSSSFSNVPQMGTTEPDRTVHPVIRRPTGHAGPRAQSTPCMQECSAKSYNSVHPSFACSASTCLYFPLSSSASISKKLSPVLGRHTEKRDRCPGLVTARRNITLPNISLLLCQNPSMGLPPSLRSLSTAPEKGMPRSMLRLCCRATRPAAQGDSYNTTGAD
mmetsp:Transcript_26127/g.36082  ORF Transcript_26127/g.36082 Transcript_26127/m.36082 type:complete len:213 (-) Transcript_26127:41-679(-)